MAGNCVISAGELKSQLDCINEGLKRGDLITDSLQVVKKHGFKWMLLKIAYTVAKPFYAIFGKGDPWTHYRIHHVAEGILQLSENNRTILDKDHLDVIHHIFSLLRKKSCKSRSSEVYLTAINKCRVEVRKLVAAPVTLNPNDIQQVRQGIDAFAQKLYGILTQDAEYANKSFSISPISIIGILGMLLSAVKSDDKLQFIEAIGMKGMEESRIHQALSVVLKELALPSNTYGAIKIVQGLAVRSKGVEIEGSFETLVENLYSGEIFQSENLKTDVNNWVDRHTNHKISEILGNDDPSLKVLLLNAIYLEFQWKYDFKEPESGWARNKFTFANGQSSTATMMTKTEDTFAVYRGDVEGNGANYDILELPYISPEGRQLYQLILLPHDPKDLDQVEKDLTSETLKIYRDKARNALRERQMAGTSLDVQVTIPKIKATSDLSLMKALRQMGLSFNIDENMIKLDSPAVGDVLHRTMVENNEKGTVGAGVAALGFATMCPPAQRTGFFHFNAKHSYSYAIMDGDTMLFRGRINDAYPFK